MTATSRQLRCLGSELVVVAEGTEPTSCSVKLMLALGNKHSLANPLPIG
jgi:hypothetical protein